MSALHVDVAWRAVFTAMLAVAALSDVRSRRIPNALSLALLAVGIVHAATGDLSPLAATLTSLGGAAVGLAIWSPAYALRMLGAGDVKLFVAAAVWLGPTLALDASIASAIVGGVLAAGWIVRRARPHDLPYGLAIAAGASFVMWSRP